MKPLNRVVVIIIGRNEGSRLIACLNSVRLYFPEVVYVDSASSDDSVAQAKKLGAYVVSLDMTKPFTAARARNYGVQAAIQQFPHVDLIQFIDGDCEVNAEWLLTAVKYLDAHNDVAVMCGRRREKYPDASCYNMLCDLEWTTPVGETKACGGDALMRLDVFNKVGGFRESLIAGEEPELCVRIRQAGYKIWRLDAEMTMHDAAITKFSQWWKRTTRSGFAFAEGAFLHGAAPEFHWVAESKRAWIWGFLIPVAIIAVWLLNPYWSMLLMLVYPIQWLRLSLKLKQPFKKAAIQALFLIVGKFAEVQGQIKFLLSYCTSKQNKIIEYK